MATGFYNYIQLAKNATPYAKRIQLLSARIFGEVSRPTTAKSMKIVDLFATEPLEQRSYIKDYYPRHVEINSLLWNLRKYGLYRDEHEDFKEEMIRLRALRGKTKTKKGEGKKKGKK